MKQNRYEALQAAIGANFLSSTGAKKPKTQEEAAEIHHNFAALNQYFYEIYGDLWLRGLNQKVEQFWRLHLIGLDLADLAGGIQHMIDIGKTQFPPNPLEFRAYCVGARNDSVRGKDINTKNLNFL